MKLKSLACVAVLSLAGAAQASLVEYHTSLASQAAGSPAGSFSLQLFDPSLGALQSVQLSFDGSLTDQVRVFNSNAVDKSFTNAYSSVPVTVSVSLPGLVSFSTRLTATASAASGTVSAGQTAYFNGSANPLNMATWLEDATTVSRFVGQGAADHTTALFLASSGLGTVGGTAASGVYFGSRALAMGDVTVSYVYQPVSAVPVPASAWLLGSGVLSMGAFMRRRRAPSNAFTSAPFGRLWSQFTTRRSPSWV